MKRLLLFAVVAAMVTPYAAFAQAKPNFSGTWTLDAAKSDPPPARGGGGGGAPGGGGGAPGGGGGRGGAGGGGRGAGGGGPVTITQTATEIVIGMNTYKFDATVDIAGRGGATSKAKTAWEGNDLVITTSTDMGGTAVEQKQVRSLSADGKEMTVVTTISGGPQAGAPRKQVYTKS